ncbi:uncharacterized protein LOC122239351 [Panthera tigris]|uniref:uncharacterized protein LOC122239351 n=1 Tax=Panthera tigris TaxID=9694 RepID=UPI001C6F7314|nr:uncharacterized protein LOC122239351 [Panthera tigris]
MGWNPAGEISETHDMLRKRRKRRRSEERKRQPPTDACFHSSIRCKGDCVFRPAFCMSPPSVCIVDGRPSIPEIDHSLVDLLRSHPEHPSGRELWRTLFNSHLGVERGVDNLMAGGVPDGGSGERGRYRIESTRRGPGLTKDDIPLAGSAANGSRKVKEDTTRVRRQIGGSFSRSICRLGGELYELQRNQETLEAGVGWLCSPTRCGMTERYPF